MRIQPVTLLLLVVMTACARVEIGDHAAVNYDGSPKRLFIVNELYAGPEWLIGDEFAAAIEPALAKCNVAVSIYRPKPMELDAEAKIKTAVLQFKPDAILGFHVTFRLISNQAPEIDTYLAQLYDATQKRNVWHEKIWVTLGVPRKEANVGGSLADQMLRTMVADNVIKTCPPLPPDKHS